MGFNYELVRQAGLSWEEMAPDLAALEEFVGYDQIDAIKRAASSAKPGDILEVELPEETSRIKPNLRYSSVTTVILKDPDETINVWLPRDEATTETIRRLLENRNTTNEELLKNSTVRFSIDVSGKAHVPADVIELGKEEERRRIFGRKSK